MKQIYGFGINDAGYPVHKKDPVTNKRWICPYFSKWQSMLERCYSLSKLKRFPSYIGCTVCEEWVYFSNFKAWMEKQDWQGKSLDKDILSGDNKVYSPDTCIFISSELNNFLTFKKSNGGVYPPGVTYQKRSKKFRASVNYNKKVITIGEFYSPDEAFLAWKAYKKILATYILKEEDVYEMRTLYATGDFSFKQLGAMFGCAREQAGHAVRGRNYSVYTKVPPVTDKIKLNKKRFKT